MGKGLRQATATLAWSGPGTEAALPAMMSRGSLHCNSAYSGPKSLNTPGHHRHMTVPPHTQGNKAKAFPRPPSGEPHGTCAAAPLLPQPGSGRAAYGIPPNTPRDTTVFYDKRAVFYTSAALHCNSSFGITDREWCQTASSFSFLRVNRSRGQWYMNGSTVLRCAHCQWSAPLSRSRQNTNSCRFQESLALAHLNSAVAPPGADTV